MALLELQLTHVDDGILCEEEMPLDADRLAVPVAAAGRDWLRLQGDEDVASLRCFLAWSPSQAGMPELDVELERDGDVVWRGRVTTTELGRIARRAANALEAAGGWPRARGAVHKLRFDVRLGDADPIPGRRREAADPAARAASTLGIEAEGLDDVEPVPAIELSQLANDRRLNDVEAPDVVLRMRKRVLRTVEALSRDSCAAGEERALLLFGTRRRLLADDGVGDATPLFDITAAVHPKVVTTTATRVVLAPTALVHEGRAASALLHTHLPEFGVGASDHDLRDLEDLPGGGPGSVSIIVRACDPSREPLLLAVYGRLGSRGGVVDRATVAVLISDDDGN